MGGILRSNKREGENSGGASDMKKSKMARIGSFVDLTRGATARTEQKPHILDNGGEEHPVISITRRAPTIALPPPPRPLTSVNKKPRTFSLFSFL